MICISNCLFMQSVAKLAEIPHVKGFVPYNRIRQIIPAAPSAWSGSSLHFSHKDSHYQAGQRGFRNGSPFGSGFPIGAISSPVGTRLCLQSLVCYTFAGQLLPSVPFAPSLARIHNCIYQTKGAGRSVAKRDAPPGISAVRQRYIKSPFPPQRHSRECPAVPFRYCFR